jgi:deferrochelatase/peroxidase EfeB
MAEAPVNTPAGRAAAVDLDDIQGLVRFAYRDHTEAVFLLLRVKDTAAARAWLAQVAVTNAVTQSPPPRTALQVALTSQGLRALGVAEDIINAFSQEFVNGIAGDSSRSRRLGDVGPSDPSYWQWGSGQRLPDLAVLLYALPGLLQPLQQSIESQLQTGFEISGRLATSNMGGHEPFGFVDGISQPELDWQRQRRVEDTTQSSYTNLSCLGEFLLGYPNEYGLYTTRPLLDPSRDESGILPKAEDAPGSCDVGRNGSYLVIRQLRQNVYAFWRALDGYASGAAAAREQLASAMVGRRLSGDPLVSATGSAATPAVAAPISAAGMSTRSAAASTPGVPVSAPGAAASLAALNNFNYLSDPEGIRCPLGAHIRRTNPRNADLPPGAAGILSWLMRTLGLNPTARELDLVASTRFHRLLRRGREYGVAVTPEQALTGEPGAEDPGLQFVCLNANLQRQFEFVQGAWLISAKFDGFRSESDPLLGNRLPLAAGMPTDNFSIPQPAGPDRRLTGLPQFVTVLGGAYFFLPGIRALRFLSGAHL